MTKPVILLGGGGHARVLLEALLLSGRTVLGITDPDAGKAAGTIMNIPVIGTDDAVLRFRPEDVELANGLGSVGSTARRAALFVAFRNRGYRFATAIHPAAVVSPTAIVEEGAQIMAGAIIQTGARIGMNAIVNTRAAVDHDCVIGAHAHLAPGVTLSGTVTVGDEVHIGTGATVIQGIAIGRGSTVGAGSVVVKTIPEGVTVYGVPAREART